MHSSSAVARTTAKSGAGVDLVQSYLDSLLRDVSVELDERVVAEAEVKTEPASVISTPVADTPPAKPSALETRVVEQPVAISPVVEPETLALTAVEFDPKSERVMPEWARHGFAGLLFEVAGLKLAAPLHALGGISLIEDRLQPVVGQADWFMGLLRWNGRNLRVVDTARFVMPERLENNDHHSAYQSVIVLGDSHWALAVDCADESVNLKSDEIRWKQLTGARPWLAGTVLHRLCALLDVDNLMTMLQQHEQQVRETLKHDHTN